MVLVVVNSKYMIDKLASECDMLVVFVRVIKCFCKLADGSKVAVIVTLNWLDSVMVQICAEGGANCNRSGWIREDVYCCYNGNERGNSDFSNRYCRCVNWLI